MPTINSINNAVGNNSFSTSLSSSGNTITETIQQTSNTAGATASQVISVAGTTAANPYLSISPDGSNNFAIGAINSAAPDFSMSYGASATPGSGTQLMKATSAGYITKPNHSAFHAYLGSNTGNVTGEGTIYTISSLTEIFDQGGDFDHTTGVFTAPVDGFYNVGYNLYTAGWVSANVLGQLWIASTGKTVTTFYGRWYNISITNGAASGNAEASFSLTAGDTVSFLFRGTGNGSKNVFLVTNTFCWGFLKS